MPTTIQESTTNPTTQKAQSVPSLRNEATDDPHLFRVVDRENSWTHYYHDQLDKYFPSVNHILGIGFPKGAGLIQWLKNKTAEEADKILESAGERGSRVHDAIRELIKGKKLSIAEYFQNEDGSSTQLTIPEWDYLLSWQAWVEAFKPQILKHETAVYNKKFGYAGTVDFIGTITVPKDSKLYINDKLVSVKTDKVFSILADWKTSKSIYNEYKLQTAAYAACMKIKPKQEFYTAVVRLGTAHKNGGFEMRLWDRVQTLNHFKRFLEVKNTYSFISGENGWKPNIEQVPLILQVNIPQINVQPRTVPKRAKTLEQGDKVESNGRKQVRIQRKQSS